MTSGAVRRYGIILFIFQMNQFKLSKFEEA